MMKVKELGEFIRNQRHGAQMSLRKLARAAGVSNPYLSQIERGLRRPSAEILQGIAKALRMSSQTLYVQAGILDAEPHPDVHTAIMGDPSLTEKQKQVLLSVYDSFHEETVQRRGRARDEPATDSARARLDLWKGGEDRRGARTRRDEPSQQDARKDGDPG
jgi:transcriptional regulator with XRE-family HTH domain